MGKLGIIGPDCYLCLLRQAFSAAKLATSDSELQKEILWRAIKIVSSSAPEEAPPAVLYFRINRMIRELSGSEDPYREHKRKANRRALDLHSALSDLWRRAEDPLLAALRISIVGNLLDLVAKPIPPSRDELLDLIRNAPFAINHYEKLKEEISKASKILVLVDNCGEIVFDKILLQELGRRGARIKVAVRGGPLGDDATLEDAKYVGLDEFAEIITTGFDGPPIFEHCSPEFLQAFEEADLVISKGAANYEILWGEDKNIFFLLPVKCPSFCRHFNCSEGALVLRSSRE